MTIEERARAYAELNSDDYQLEDISVDDEDKLYAAYIAGATDDKWTMVNQKEDYPPDGELVLVRDTRDLIYLNLCVNDTWHTHMGHPITHWHPLPSLPPTGNKSL